MAASSETVAAVAAVAVVGMIERAHQMYREGRHSEALGLYSEALAMARTKAQRIALHSNHAACYLELHDFRKGDLIQKDFDIRKAAGGKSLTVVQQKYVVPVTKSFLDIHLFWAGKGTCCIPTQGYCSPAISAINVSPYELFSIVGRPNVFSYGELRAVTDSFSSKNILGEGGYGSLYKQNPVVAA